MTSTIQKWGNSLALRIPQPFAKDIHLHKGSEVELSVIQDKIVIVPKKQSKYTLASLLKKVHKENLHSEQNWGKAQGKEIW